MLSRMLPTARRAITGRTILAQGRFPVSQLQASSFHAGPVLREEEKAAEPAEKSSFLMDCLTDWNRAVPIGVACAIPACSLDVYMVTEETQLFCCFMLFIGTAYSLGGDALGAHLDEKADAILKEHNAVEDLQIEAAETTLEAHKTVLNVQEDLKSLYEAQIALIESTSEAQTLRLKHAVRNSVVTKLDSIAQQEASFSAGLQTIVVQAATENVTQAFVRGDGKLKANALTYAMDALAGKDVGPDAVSKMYAENLSNFSKEIDSVKGKEIDLTPELAKAISEEIDAIKRRDGLESIDVAPPTKLTFNL